MTPSQTEYQRYLRTFRWRFLRWLRWRIDGGRCRMCGASKRLEVHHRDYEHRGRSLWNELADLTTLCRNCHDDFHDGD